MADITVGYDSDGNALDYTTMASAYTAASEYDTLIPYYSSSGQSSYWLEQLSAMGNIGAKVVNITGGLSHQRVTFRERNNTTGLTCSGDLSGKSKITFENFTTIGGTGNVSYGVKVYNNGATTGGGADIKRLRVFGGGYGIFVMGTTGTVQNCIISDCYTYGIYHNLATADGTVGVYFNTVTRTRQKGVANLNNASGIFKNNLVVDTYGGFDSSAANGGKGYNACNGFTYPLGTGSFTVYSHEDCGFISLQSNGKYPVDFRVATDSPLVGQGIAISGITEDFDGETRSDPPTIGASEGMSFSSGGGRRTRGRYHAI